MTIPRLPGLGDEMAELLPKLGEAVKTIMNPNWKLQEELKKGLAANPGMALELANLESQQPGLLQSLGYGDIGRQIAQMGPTQEFQNEQAVTRATGQLLQNPNNATILAKEKSGLGQAESRVIADKATTAQTNIATAQEADRVKDVQRREAGRVLLNTNVQRYGGARGIAQAVRSGQMPWEEIDAMGSADGWEVVRRMMDEDFQREEMAFRLRLQREGQSVTHSELLQNQAFQMFRDSEYVGHPAGYQALLANPAQALSKAEEYMTMGRGAITDPQERAAADALVTSVIGGQKVADDLRSSQINAAQARVQQATNGIKKASNQSDKDMQQAILNTALAELARLSGKTITPAKHIDTWKPLDEGWYTEIEGKRVKLDDLDSHIAGLVSTTGGWRTELDTWRSGQPVRQTAAAASAVEKVLGAINSGRLTLDQAMASPALNQAQKDSIRSRAGGR